MVCARYICMMRAWCVRVSNARPHEVRQLVHGLVLACLLEESCRAFHVARALRQRRFPVPRVPSVDGAATGPPTPAQRTERRLKRMLRLVYDEAGRRGE